MAIRCAHCKKDTTPGAGSHDTVAQVKLCSRRHGVGVPVQAADVVASVIAEPTSASAASALAELDHIAWKDRMAAREADEERAVYQHMVDTDTV